MSRGICSAEMQEQCPLQRCEGSNEHHLAYPRQSYKAGYERKWRNLPMNKTQLETCLHRAIHYSGYMPPMPDRDTMMEELNSGDTQRADNERDKQIKLGEIVLYGYPDEEIA